MTVCIGVLCERKQNVILVADRMLTSGLAIEFEHPVSNKITRLSPNCLALTAGNAFAFTELFAEVQTQTDNMRSTSVEQFVEIMKETYQRLRQKQIIERILMPRGLRDFGEFYKAQAMGLSDSLAFPILSEIDRFEYGLEILVGGISPAGAHLYAIHDPGTSYCLDSIGFHVIGTGTNLALSSLIANQCHQELPLADAVLVALGAKMTAENAPGVGRKTDLSLILQANGAIHPLQFDDESIKQLRELSETRKSGGDSYESAFVKILERSLAPAASIPDTGHSVTMTRGGTDGQTSGKAQGESGLTGVRTADDSLSHQGGESEGRANGEGVSL